MHPKRPPYSRAELRNLAPTIGPEEAARVLGTGRSRVYKMCRSGELPARTFRLGNRWRIVTADLLTAIGVDPEGGEVRVAG